VIAHGATPEFLHRIWDHRVTVLVVLAAAFVALVAARAIVSAVRRDPSRI
jgi:hypothetical protein